MGKKTPLSPVRVVIDTNGLVSALIFSHGRCAWLRQAWQAGRFIPLASQDTVGELLRVLSYPKFNLSRDEQETLLADYLPYVETVKIETTPTGLPDIRDADDLMFLALAILGDADALVSGDADLHAVKPRFPIPIMTPTEFADWLAPDNDSAPV
ncbi:MAG: putative toxin-antitoxin system toxin component, PIN family [Lamprobacter sp.]|uniref:putative toxin-antitoxin system toxin component, PIN family n=1 Tax=Lamprobacter sp. TaxID=3100796 RepID=UPI002B25F928|nr:putative toxin-antitoxin system toxin component, PIN family [Lamprobacter sp.]MEA3642459.1 putative toxin-antitoxin system toxin component, PIN family [Lamprobacter sp.]